MKQISWCKQRYYSDPIPPETLSDVALLAQLWADQFPHMTPRRWPHSTF